MSECKPVCCFSHPDSVSMRKKKQSAHLRRVLGAEVGLHSLILLAMVSDSLKTGSWPRDHVWSSMVLKHFLGFPGVSDGKESACNPGGLGWEDLLEEGMATHSSILAWKIPTDRGAWQVEVHEVAKSQTWLNDFHSKYLKVFSGFCSTVDPPPNPLNQL